MSLATRCTACGTIFRVVQDQLKVSEGWVRCGRCDAVFDAASGLFDLEQQAPPDWQPTAPPVMDAGPSGAAVPDPQSTAASTDEVFISEDERRWSASMAAQGLSANGAGAAVDEAPASRSSLPPASSLSLPPLEATRSAPAFEPPSGLLVRNTEDAGHGGHAHDGSRDEEADEDDDVIVITDHPSGTRTAASAQSSGFGVGRGNGDDETEAESTSPPDFLRRARRQAFWRSGRIRALLGTLALVLVMALLLQTSQQFSELAAARWPGLRPALTAWCGVSGCSVGPPHRIDDIVVESTALSPAPAASGLRLAVTLRNRAAYAVASPSIDLSLTDMTGKLIARRALSPSDFSPAAPAVAAGVDLPLQTVLTAAGGASRVAGYTVEIFYP